MATKACPLLTSSHCSYLYPLKLTWGTKITTFKSFIRQHYAFLNTSIIAPQLFLPVIHPGLHQPQSWAHRRQCLMNEGERWTTHHPEWVLLCYSLMKEFNRIMRATSITRNFPWGWHPFIKYFWTKDTQFATNHLKVLQTKPCISILFLWILWTYSKTYWNSGII